MTEPVTLPEVAGRLDRSYADFERACLVLLADEQRKPNPDNALIAVLCDAVRLTREVVEAGPGTLPRGFHEGVLYCYGGCGTRYKDFPRDVHLPTHLWNRIAVGPPFDETQNGIERDGRGGVLCPACIVARLAALPECTVINMDVATEPGMLPVSVADREESLKWAESAGQRLEISERIADLRARYKQLAARDMAKARAFLGLPEGR